MNEEHVLPGSFASVRHGDVTKSSNRKRACLPTTHSKLLASIALPHNLFGSSDDHIEALSNFVKLYLKRYQIAKWRQARGIRDASMPATAGGTVRFNGTPKMQPEDVCH